MKNTLTISTQGEAFYEITSQIQAHLKHICTKKSGVLFLFVMHTSCALTISEAYDPSAKRDLESFMQNLAPRDLAFIEHTLEGPDDSPSHMKSILLQQHLAICIEQGKMVLGKWQGIYLAEFRDQAHNRSVLMKFLA